MKIALKGQWKDVSGLIYTYPESLSGTPEWTASVPDPREVRTLLKDDGCFSLWYNNNGYYYACTKTKTDERNGCVMLVILAGKKVPLDGKMMADKMRSLLDYCLSKEKVGDIEDVDIHIKAKEIEDLLTDRALPREPQADEGTAYRLYKDDDELGLILENPNQPAYKNSKRILVIRESSFAGIQGQQMAHITETVKKTYDIVTDDRNAVPSCNSVMKGDPFTITFKKEGCVDECVEVVAGRQTQYCFLNDKVINIRSAEAAGIRFKREIQLYVADNESGKPLRKWSFKMEGKKEETVKDEPSKTIRIEYGKSCKLIVYAEGYEKKEVVIDSAEKEKKTVKLQSTDDSVYVRLQLGKEEYLGSVKMKSNNELYYPLKRLDENNKVLQVKRPFFSRRNLVPILVLFLVSLLLGGSLGFVINGKKITQQPITATVDSATYNQLKVEFEALREKFESVNKENEINKQLLPLYGNVLSKIKEKIDMNPEAVFNALDKDDYSALLKGNEKDLQKFKKLEDNLQSIQKKTTDGGSGDGNNKGGTSGPSNNNLGELLSEDSWDLNSISNTGAQGSKFVEKLQNTTANDLTTLLTGQGAYKTARDKNSTWNTILQNANSLDQGDKKKFFAYMNENPRKKDGVLYLKEVEKFFNQ